MGGLARLQAWDSVHWYGALQVTSSTRLSPAIDGSAAARARSFARSIAPRAMIPFMEPDERSFRTSERVSIPLMPGTSWRFRYASSDSRERQFDGKSTWSRTTKPDRKMPRDSSSSGLVPVFPISG